MTHPPHEAVPAAGPLDARLLVVGEAPGRQEVEKLTPFVGDTGRYVRKTLDAAGVRVGRVRFNNAIPLLISNPSPKDLRTHWDWLEHDLRTCTAPVVVAMGGLALARLHGSWNIADAHGGVWPLRIGAFDRVLVACMHPASFMRSRLWAMRDSVTRVLHRAAEYALGRARWSTPVPEIVFPSADDLDAVLSRATEISVDSEYDESTHVPFAWQFSVGDGRAYLTGAGPSIQAVLARQMRRPDVTWIAHSHLAEVESLWRSGIEPSSRWFDTLAAFTVLYPDLPASLRHVGAFYLDNVDTMWKEREVTDPVYRALDVEIMRRTVPELRAELTLQQLWPAYERVMRAMPWMHGLEIQGLYVDTAAQARVRETLTAEALAAEVEAGETASSHFATRIEEERAACARIEAEIARVLAESAVAVRCSQHPSYDGMRKKRWAKDVECTCAWIYDQHAQIHDAVAKLREQRTRSLTKLKRWSSGFESTNNEHLRWLLYEGFGLPRQFSADNRPTADATAIEKLCALSSTPENVRVFLRAVKRAQHARKLLSTFANPPVDADGYAHPEHRAWGPGTGRAAGGADAKIASDRGVSPYSFNVFNIPDDMRVLFVEDPS